MSFHVTFEEELEKLPQHMLLRFINCVADKHSDIAISKVWFESSDVKTMMNVKVIFFSFNDSRQKSTKYLYTDYTSFEKSCSNMIIEKQED